MVVYLSRETEKKDAIDGVPDRPPSIAIPPEVIAAMAVERAAGNYSRMYRVLRKHLEQTDLEGQKRQIVWLGIAEEINGDSGSQLSNLVRRFLALRSAEKGELVSPQEFQKASNQMAEEIYSYIEKEKVIDFWFFQKDIASMAENFPLAPHEWPGGLSIIMPNFSFINPLGLDRVDLFSRQAIRDRLRDAGQHDASKEAEALGDGTLDQIGRWGSLAGTGLGALRFKQPFTDWFPDRLWGGLYLKSAGTGPGEFYSPLLAVLTEGRAPGRADLHRGQGEAGKAGWLSDISLSDENTADRSMLQIDEAYGPFWKELKQSLAVVPDLAYWLGSDVGLWQFDRPGSGTDYRFVSDSLATISINGYDVTTLSRQEAVRRRGRKINLGEGKLRYMLDHHSVVPEAVINNFSDGVPHRYNRLVDQDNAKIVQEFLASVRDVAGKTTAPGLDTVNLRRSLEMISPVTGKPITHVFDKLYPVTKEGILTLEGQLITTYTPEEARARKAAQSQDRKARLSHLLRTPLLPPLPEIPMPRAGSLSPAPVHLIPAPEFKPPHLLNPRSPSPQPPPPPPPPPPSAPKAVARPGSRKKSGMMREFQFRPDGLEESRNMLAKLTRPGEARPLLRGAPLPFPSDPAEPPTVVEKVVRVEERIVAGDERSFDHRPWKMSLEDAVRQSAMPALGYR